MFARAMVVTLMAASCLSLASCAAREGKIEAGSQVAGIDEMSELYAQATAHHRRAVRKPIRDQREQTLRRLSEAAGDVLAETRTWSDARLTSMDASRRDEVRATVEEFRDSLRGIQEGARQGDMRQLRQQYAMAMAHYRELEGAVPPGE